MDFVIGFIFVWLVWGVSMLISNTKDLPILAMKIFPITRKSHSFIYIPLWWLMCIVLIIIYPAFNIRGMLLKVYHKHFKNKA